MQIIERKFRKKTESGWVPTNCTMVRPHRFPNTYWKKEKGLAAEIYIYTYIYISRVLLMYIYIHISYTYTYNIYNTYIYISCISKNPLSSAATENHFLPGTTLPYENPLEFPNRKHPRPRPWPSAWSSDSWSHLKTDWPPGFSPRKMTGWITGSSPVWNGDNQSSSSNVVQAVFVVRKWSQMLYKQFCCLKQLCFQIFSVHLRRLPFQLLEKGAVPPETGGIGPRRSLSAQAALSPPACGDSHTLHEEEEEEAAGWWWWWWWWYVKVLTQAIVKRQNFQGHCTFWAFPGQLCQCHGCSLLAGLRVTRLLPQNLKVLVHRPGNGCCSLSCLHKCLLLWQLLK